MPELPEVETVLRTLEHRIAGQEITEVRVIWGKTVIGDPDEFCRRLKGRHFLRFMRRGKYLLFGMEDCILMSHLRMEGKYFIQKPEEKLIPHTHVVFGLSGGDELRYNDTRKFGRMEILPADTDLNTFHDLGPEPFDEAFSAEYIHAWRRGRTMPVKSMLLNQNFCAGIGNIYADEILYACGIRPGRSCSRLKRKEEEMIVTETRRILHEAILAGGTTIRSYTSSLGVTGLFQLSCKVHTMKTCSTCGHDIKIRRIGGRSSYYCPVCQK